MANFSFNNNPNCTLILSLVIPSFISITILFIFAILFGPNTKCDVSPDKERCNTTIFEKFSEAESYLNDLLNTRKQMEFSILRANSRLVQTLGNKYKIRLPIKNLDINQLQIHIDKDMFVVNHPVKNNNFDYVAQIGYDMDKNSITTSYKDDILTINIPRIEN